MEIINLPDHLKIEGSSSFKIFDYETSKECFKQMVFLKQNTFSFLIEGSKEVYSERTTVSIKNSSFLLMKAGHCLMTEKLPDTMDHYRSILFFFSNDSLLEFIQKYKLENANKYSRETVYSFKYDAFLKSFVKSITDIVKLNPSVQSKLLEIKFEELMVYLVDTNGVDFIYSLISNANNQHRHFIEVVETNKLNKLTIKELSFLSNMSVSTFKREFEKYFQESPSKWFLEKRLEHSAFLLKNKSNRPSEIYEIIGYENLSNFIQAFKSKFGVTPKQYQQVL